MVADRTKRSPSVHDAGLPYGSARSSEVLYEVADHIATITLNAPERMNTISGPMLGALSDAAARGRPRPRRALHRAHRRGPGVLRRARPGRADERPEGFARQPRRARRQPRRVRPARRSADRAAQPRHAHHLRAERRRRRLRPRPRARLRHPHRRRVGPSSTPASPSGASCPRAAAPGCCRGWSATRRPPRSPSPAAR